MKKRCLTILLSVITSGSMLFETNANAIAYEIAEPIEIVSKRSEYEKHFDNGDGTITAFINTVPIHHFQNGEWQEIDNTLVLDEYGNYTNASNSMNVTLASSASVCSINSIAEEQRASIEYNGYSISWNLINTQPQSTSELTMSDSISNLSINATNNINEIDLNNPKISEDVLESMNKLESNVSYNSLYNDLDVNISVNSTSVKETIVLNNSTNVPEHFTYYFEANGLSAEIYEDNSIHFFNESLEEIFIIPSAYMTESSENMENCYNVDVELLQYHNGYLLTLIPDTNMIQNDSNVYAINLALEQSAEYNNVTCSYIMEETPNQNFSDLYLRVGGSYSDSERAESFLSFPESFASFSNTAEIIDAKCNVYIASAYGTGDLPGVDVNLIVDPPGPLTWTEAGEKRKRSIKINSFQLSTLTTGYYGIDITGLTQIWLNYSKTNHVQGKPNYGINLSMSNPTGDYKTLTMFSTRYGGVKPYFEIDYRENSPYAFNYAPDKYNNFTSSDGTYSINNFQNRMNCYAYALQVYYKGTLSSGASYSLMPGEFGISLDDTNNIQKYSDLEDIYEDFENKMKSSTSQYYPITYVNQMHEFVDKQLYLDAEALNFDISKLNTSSSFSLPSDFDGNSERIIAMFTYYNTSTGEADSHFYARNGNGTCSNGHGGNCSMWSHKAGNSPVINTCASNSQITLCDQNISQYATSLHGTLVKSSINYYVITKDTYLYNSWHGNNISTGSTPYQP